MTDYAWKLFAASAATLLAGATASCSSCPRVATPTTECPKCEPATTAASPPPPIVVAAPRRYVPFKCVTQSTTPQPADYEREAIWRGIQFFDGNFGRSPDENRVNYDRIARNLCRFADLVVYFHMRPVDEETAQGRHRLLRLEMKERGISGDRVFIRLVEGFRFSGAHIQIEKRPQPATEEQAK